MPVSVCRPHSGCDLSRVEKGTFPRGVGRSAVSAGLCWGALYQLKEKEPGLGTPPCPPPSGCKKNRNPGVITQDSFSRLETVRGGGGPQGGRQHHSECRMQGEAEGVPTRPPPSAPTQQLLQCPPWAPGRLVWGSPDPGRGPSLGQPLGDLPNTSQAHDLYSSICSPGR